MEETVRQPEGSDSLPTLWARKLAAGRGFGKAIAAYSSHGQKEIFDQACLDFLQHIVRETFPAGDEPEEAMQIGMVTLLEALHDHAQAHSTRKITSFVRQRIDQALSGLCDVDSKKDYSPLKGSMPCEEPLQSIFAEQALLAERVAKMLKTLSYREREIIKLRYGLGDGFSYTLEEVGHIFKVTKERIREIEARAIQKLRQPSRAWRLEDFL